MYWVSVTKGRQQMNENEYEALVELSWQQEHWRTWRGEGGHVPEIHCPPQKAQNHIKGVNEEQIWKPQHHTLFT